MKLRNQDIISVNTVEEYTALFGCPPSIPLPFTGKAGRKPSRGKPWSVIPEKSSSLPPRCQGHPTFRERIWQPCITARPFVWSRTGFSTRRGGTNEGQPEHPLHRLQVLHALSIRDRYSGELPPLQQTRQPRLCPQKPSGCQLWGSPESLSDRLWPPRA